MHKRSLIKFWNQTVDIENKDFYAYSFVKWTDHTVRSYSAFAKGSKNRILCTVYF